MHEKWIPFRPFVTDYNFRTKALLSVLCAHDRLNRNSPLKLTIFFHKANCNMFVNRSENLAIGTFICYILINNAD